MKKGRITPLRSPIGVSWGLAIYAVTLVLLILLAQIVAIPFTNALVLLCLAMPIPSVVCLLIALPFVSADARNGTATAVRATSTSVRVDIKNRSILPISSAKVVCRIPDQNGERKTVGLKKKISLAPFASVTLEARPVALRRGRFEVGASEMLLYDLLHIVKIRKRIDGAYILAVLPKLLHRESGEYDESTEDGATSAVEVFSSYEYDDVREYRVGDPMKRIHWKLCAKDGELHVKKNVAENSGYVCIVCDRSVDAFGFGIPRDVLNELDDETVEEAMLSVSEICCRDGRGCLSVGTDDGNAVLLQFGGDSDEEETRYILSGLEKGDCADAACLVPENATSVRYIMTYLSPKQARGVFDARKICESQEFNVCIRDVSALVPKEKTEEYRASLDSFRNLLYENGISFFTVTEGGETDEK